MMGHIAVLSLLSLASTAQSWTQKPKLYRTPEAVELCTIIRNPARYSGHGVAFGAEVFADGMPFSLLTGASCRRGIAPDFDKAPAAGEEFGMAIFTGRPGTID